VNSISQITSSWSSASDLAKVVMVLAGCLVLFVAFKVGGFILKILFGLAGLALLVGSFWWFFSRN
jgi:hypothetical protein